jgi:para-aminobenzoate synthetase / 4-amino-4-deoxychorismate lyase
LNLLHSSSAPATDCFALLDDSSADDAQCRSRLYRGHVGTLRCDAVSGVPALLDGLQLALRQGQHAVALFSYELGADLQGVAPHPNRQLPLAQLLLFSRCNLLTTAEVDAWLTARSAAEKDSRPAGIADIQPNVSAAEFDAAIAQIHAYLEAGDTYQVNYTYRLRFDAYGSACALYRRLRSRQPVPYGALLALPDGGALLSLSPELFVRHAHGLLTARPMKGTAAASGDAQQDAARAAALAADPKNRAENLMIVDLLRNDLGRIAQPGSVQVPALFEVQRYSSVLQMTSTVQARLRDNTTLNEILEAIYPCGSITGAPKRRTMQIIRELEAAPRGWYTGAIGWFEPASAGREFGAFCLSVPIRTLVLQPPQANGIHPGEMGVGAGIVHDSVAADEYAECQLKARFLTGLEQDFTLFETMLATLDAGCRHLERHLQRLRGSAQYFGFAYDETRVRESLHASCARLAPGAHRLKLTLTQSGAISVQTAPLTPLPEPVRLLLASQHTTANDLFLRHKSSVRQRYDAGWRFAEAQNAFDMLFCNERGELTEGGRSNLFIQLDGRWHTPPLASGVLPGIMRAVLLADPAWDASERILTLDDLRAAQQVVVCNALRGAMIAAVVWR